MVRTMSGVIAAIAVATAASVYPAAAIDGNSSLPSAADIVSDDSTSRDITLVVNKSITLDLPKAAVDVLVANKAIANAILRSKRRVYLIGTGKGQTNIFFYDGKGNQIEALDITVTDHPVSTAKEISVIRGISKEVGGHEMVVVYKCTPDCELIEKTPPPPEPTYILPNVTNVTNNNTASQPTP